jgi:hypothetical protein
MRDDDGGVDHAVPFFLSPFGHRHSLLGHPFPSRGSAPLTIGLPARFGAPDHDGVSMFRTRETRLGLGALSTPGTAVFSRPTHILDRRLPLSIGQPLFFPVQLSDPGSTPDEASARVHCYSPAQPFPRL